MKLPPPSYPCHFCADINSFPADMLHYSRSLDAWVCECCWEEEIADEDMGPTLQEALKQHEQNRS